MLALWVRPTSDLPEKIALRRMVVGCRTKSLLEAKWWVEAWRTRAVVVSTKLRLGMETRRSRKVRARTTRHRCPVPVASRRGGGRR